MILVFVLLGSELLICFFPILHFRRKSTVILFILDLSLFRCVKFFTFLLKYFLANFYVLTISIFVEFSAAIRTGLQIALLLLGKFIHCLWLRYDWRWRLIALWLLQECSFRFAIWRLVLILLLFWLFLIIFIFLVAYTPLLF